MATVADSWVRLRDADYYYYFDVTTGGRYELLLHQTDGGGTDRLLASGTTPAIRKGHGATNRLTIGASGSTFQLWVNGSYLTTVSDGTIPWGTIGVAVSMGSQGQGVPTVVQYRGAEIWLPADEEYSQ